jgi:hypothetical protein
LPAIGTALPQISAHSTFRLLENDMKELRQRAFVGLGLVGLLSTGLAWMGCSSGSGSSGTGGSSGATGGSTGSGGTGGGEVGGTSGGGAGGGAVACAVPTSATITDFGSTTQVSSPYKGADTGLTVPTVDTSGGKLVVTVDTGSPTTQYPYAYVGLPFNACVDASSYTGVKFNISGTLNAGCTIQFSAVDKEHSTPGNGGTCTAANCYASSKIFTLPSTDTDVSVAFADQTGGGADSTAAAVDPTEILNVQWQLNVPVAVGDAGGGGCQGSFTVNSVSFY